MPKPSIVLLLLTTLIANCCSQSIVQQKCAEYKRQIYEETRTFSFLVPGAKSKAIKRDFCVREYDPFVVGGTLAKPKEFPHMALLGNRESNDATVWFCGGSLLNDRFVLTAAHCFYSSDGIVNVVRLGELDLDKNDEVADPQDFDVLRDIEHPNYVNGVAHHDIALIELSRTVLFNAYRHPVCLPTADDERFNDFLAVGWGSTAFAAVTSRQLRKVALQRYGQDRCVSLYKSTNRQASDINANTFVCAGSEQRKDTCSGDSGGPLLAYHPDFPCMYFAIGVTSLGFGGCGTPGVPALYTRVAAYANWINGIIWH